MGLEQDNFRSWKWVNRLGTGLKYSGQTHDDCGIFKRLGVVA